MKSLPLFAAVSLFIAPLVSTGQVTTLFQDTFASGGLSTLNPTATSPGILTGTRTAYEIASSKGATSTTIASGVMTYGNFSTSSGYCEGQALFTNSPVQLTTPGQYIEVYYVFTATTTLFNGAGGANEQINIGLYNSGGSPPTNGTSLWNSGLSSSLTSGDVGCTKGWLGYDGMVAYSTNVGTAYTSEIYTRAAQSAANNLNQGLGEVSGATLTGIIGGPGALSSPTLTVGNQYTLDLKIYYASPTSLLITNTLYIGSGNGGSVFSSGATTWQYGGTVTGGNFLTNSFDGICIGFRPTSNPTTAETMKINNVTVLLATPVAPAITGLTNQTVIQGNNAVLNPTVTGVPTAADQWYLSTDGGVTSNAIPSATGSTLNLPNVQYSQNNYQYTLVSTNTLGTNSATMTLTVIVPPTITGLGNQAGNVGQTITIAPTVSGVPAPALQWQTNGVNVTDGLDANGSIIAGSTTSTLNITNAQIADSVTYSLIATNLAGAVTNSMTLTISAGSQAPVITGPTNITVIQGNNGTFSASVTGVPVPTEQWLDQTQTPIPGQTNLSLTLTNVQYSQNGYTYYLVASNSANIVTNSATLTVIVPPAITAQPTSLVVTNTQSASLSVTASGVPSPTYQWYFNNNPISLTANSSANSATLAIPSASPTNTGNYYVQISNTAGTTNSATVTLTVNSVISTTAMTPNNGQTGVCYDTPLYLTFNGPPALANKGTIKIYNVTNSTTPVDTINLTQSMTNNPVYAANVQPYNIGGQVFTNFPVIITGNTAAIYPHHGVLSSNQTYYVTIDDGAFSDQTGAYFAGISATNVWQFTTKMGGPANATNIVVAQDYSGDFATVEGAIDSVPANNTTPTLITIHNGTYTEVVNVQSKNNITLRGQSRSGTIITYANNSDVYGSTHNRMVFRVDANNISLDNLTVSNSTPQDASQAEAIMLETGAANFIVNNCNVDSTQDTILANISTSKGYFNNTLVQGDVDFIWGGGNLFFTNCQILYLTRPGGGDLGPNPSPNPTTDLTSNGFSFVSCSLETLASVTPYDTVGRTRSITNGNTALINCFISTNIGGWFSDAVPTNLYRNWYYNCTNDFGNVVTLSNGIPLSAGDPNVTLASSATNWLYGWQPQLSPNILTNPVGQTVAYDGNATFAVAATGVPNPTYQWQLNGTNISGATGSSYTVTGASYTNAGNYTVIVTTPAGTATSAAAALIVNPPATPVFTSPPSGTNIIINAGVSLAVSCAATDADVPPQSLAYTLLTGPSGAAVDLVSGNFTWRPTVPQANSVNTVSVVATDNDPLGLAATNTFSVTVNPVTQPGATSTAYAGGVFSVGFTGQIGPDYELQSTTNLLTGPWVDVVTTNSPASMPVTLSDPNAGSQPAQFYRIVVGPPLP